MPAPVDAAFWRGRRVFLTGHTGFKGSWLALWLRELGAQVVGYSEPPPTSPSLFEACAVAHGLEHVEGDIRDVSAVSRALATARPEVVIHLAAQALVRQSYEDPVGTFATNVMGTVHLLQAVRHSAPEARAVLCVTSDKCYENREWLWGYREDEPLGGHDPYSASKASAELVTSAYRRSWFANGAIGVASARSGNVIGGGDWARDRLAVDAVTAFQGGTPLRLRNPDAIRPWQHVLEPLAGYLRLCERLAEAPGAFSEAWNFGPQGEPAAVKHVADRLAALWGKGALWEQDPDAHPHEARSLALDCHKALVRLQWRPRWSLERALSATTDWYRSYFEDPRSILDFTLRQIAEYQASPPLQAAS